MDLSKFVEEIKKYYDDHRDKPHAEVKDNRWNDLHNLVQRHAFSITDLPAYLDALRHANTVGLDDRQLLLEKVLVLMSRLEHPEISHTIQQLTIGLLYKDLPHPPTGYLALPSETLVGVLAERPHGHPIKYAFRCADGSNYNPSFPSLGRAGSPYARSVPSASCVPASALPDPGLVFDTLLRREKFEPHPDGISSLFFAFADLVIHSIFDTRHSDWTINDASSYLDLSILYGSSQVQLDEIRCKDGSGKLWEDTFADRRLLLMPPATCALLVLLSRNHNYIAQRILDINERGTFHPLPLQGEQLLVQDDEIFHRARLVNCGYFMQIILGDYVGAILGLARDGCDWRLDPLMQMRDNGHELVPRGEGNAVSVEFNMLYRWHATLSEEDTKWTEDLFRNVFKGQEPSEIDIRTFAVGVADCMKKLDKNPRNWTFNNLSRGPDGRFKDDDLAKILQDATEHRAGAFQARGTPPALRIIEIMGIQQSRSWGICSLNEFRKFMGLKPYATFEDWNPDPEISKAAQALYRDINNLELYVGLQAEQTKAPGPGAGLCPGYTISRAILADAVCLTRGDRFLTTDFTPYNLTAWGYQDCQYDKKDGSYGGMLTKLLFRTLPNHYPAGSAYAHFPFMVPKHMKDRMSKDKYMQLQVSKYNWDRPSVPTSIIRIDKYSAVKQVLSRADDFLQGHNDSIFVLLQSYLVKNLTDKDESKRQVAIKKAKQSLVEARPSIQAVLSAQSDKWAKFFGHETAELVKKRSFAHSRQSTRYLDIVKDVLNLLPLHWVSQVSGLSFKSQVIPNRSQAPSEDDKKREYDEQQIYNLFGDVARYVYFNYDAVGNWHSRENATSAASIVVKAISKRYPSDSAFRLNFRARDSDLLGQEFLAAVNKARENWTDEEAAAYIFAEVVPTLPFFSQLLAHIINYFLDEEQRSARQEILNLITSQDSDADTRLMAYFREALRLDPPVSIIYRTAAKDVDLPDLKVRTSQRVFVDVAAANSDGTVFATAPSFKRPVDQEGVVPLLDAGGLLASPIFQKIAPQVLRVILSLPNLQRGPGQSGHFTRFQEHLQQVRIQQYINAQGKIVPWPDSLIVQYEPENQA